MLSYNQSKKAIAMIFNKDLTDYIMTYFEDPIKRWAKGLYIAVLNEIDPYCNFEVCRKWASIEILRELSHGDINHFSVCIFNNMLHIKNKKMFMTTDNHTDNSSIITLKHIRVLRERERGFKYHLCCNPRNEN